MSSDLEASLVKGGLSPSIAKVIANAISNAASTQLSVGRQYGDATPVSQMRLIDADTRRYVLTNLDYAPNATATRGATPYQSKDAPHPYKDSQPATAQPTISTPAVVAGDYVAVKSGSTDQVAQAVVSIRLTERGGKHPRLDTAAKAVEAVPFSVEIDQKQLIEAVFDERAEGTVLEIRLKNLTQMTDSTGVSFLGWKV